MPTRKQKIAAFVAHRAERASKPLTDYNAAYLANDDPMQDYCASDLIVDIRHFCDAKGWDWELVMRRVDMHYNAEIRGEDFD